MTSPSGGNGAQIAELAVRVDWRSAQDAGGALDKLAASAEGAEAKVTALGRSADREFKATAIAVRQDVLQAVQALEREFENAQASIRLDLAAGIIDPKEAEQAGRDAAKRFNAGLVAELQRGQAAGAFNRNTEAGSKALVGLSDRLKDVGQAGRRSGLGLGRLNDAMVTVARQSLGLNAVSGKLIDTVGTFAIGTAYMVPVLAGLAAIGGLWAKITEDAREAEKAQKAAASFFDRIRQQQEDTDRGAGGEAQRQREALLEREADLTEKIVDRRRELNRAIRRGRSDSQIQALRDQIGRLNDDLAETVDLLGAADRAIGEARSAPFAALSIDIDAQQRTLEAREQGAEASRVLQIELQREAALREVLAGASDADRESLTALVNAKFDLIQANAEAVEAERERAEAAREAERAEKEAAREAEAAAKAEKERAESVAETVAALRLQVRQEQELRGVTDDRDRDRILQQYDEQRRLAELLADATAEEAAAIRDLYAAYIELREANDLANRTRAEFLSTLPGDDIVADAEDAAVDFESIWTDALESVGGLFGDFGRSAAELLGGILSGNPAAIVGGITAGIGGALGGLFGGGQSDAEKAAAEREATREAERLAEAFRELRQSLADDLATRRLEATGQSAEADELRRQRRQENEIDELVAAFFNNPRAEQSARDQLGPTGLGAIGSLLYGADLGIDPLPGLRELLESLGPESLAEQLGQVENPLRDFLETLIETFEVQGLEDAAKAAADALREAEEAERERLETLRRTRQAIIDAANIESREAALAGDDRGAVEARARAARDAALFAAEDRLEAGELEADLYARLVDVINGEYLKALEDFDEETRRAADALNEAAAAEAFRAEQDLGRLKVLLLREQGLDAEADALADILELQAAMNDERSAEYLAVLRQLQATRAANRERQREEQATRANAEAAKEAGDAIDGMTRSLRNPAGLILPLLRSQVLRGTATAGTFGQTERAAARSITVNFEEGSIVAAEGQSVEEVAAAVVDRIFGAERVGGFSPSAQSVR